LSEAQILQYEDVNDINTSFAVVVSIAVTKKEIVSWDAKEA